MTPEQFQRVEQLFDAACALPPAEREAFLTSAGDDPAVLAAVRALLAEDARGEAGTNILSRKLGAVSRAAERTPEGSPLPAKIGSFDIVRLIGKGGMGIVYEAEQSNPRRRVALKLVRDAEFLTPVEVRMFEREAETLARLRHPNIAAVYETGRTPEGRPWFAMELVNGVTLDVFLQGRPALTSDAELRLRLRMFAAIASAVHYAHQRGVIHRDLKPANILVAVGAASGTSTSVTPTPEVKVLDFGLARIVDAERGAASLLTEVGVIKGTLPYMSPEQARGRAEEIDVRSDVYSLGVILYEMLAGVRPYAVDQAAIAEVLRVICEATPPPLHRASTTRFRLDADLDTIVQKALEKEVDRRYASAQALADDVERFLSSQPILARPASAAYQLRKMVQRHRAAFAVGAAALLLLVAATAFSTIMYLRADREQARARSEAAKNAESARFLTKTLEAAGPSIATGRDTVLLQDILSSASARIDRELQSQPEVEASIRNTLGTTYLSLGKFVEAERHLAAAQSKLAALSDAPARDVAMVTSSFGLLRWLGGREAEAEQLYRRTLAMRQAMHAGDHVDVAATLTDLGNVLVALNRYDEAEPLLQQGLAMRERLLGPQDALVAINLNSLANLFHHRGQFGPAEKHYRRALAIEVMTLGRLHPDTITTRTNLGQLLGKTGDWPGSLEALEQSHGDALELYGARHPNVARGLNALAYAQRMMGKLAEAEASARQAVALMRELLGERNSESGMAENQLALVLEARDKIDEAEAGYRRALAIYQAAKAPASQVASAQGNLATVLSRRGKFAEALAMQQLTLDSERKRLGEDHPTVLLLRNNLARILRDSGDLDGAEREFRDVIERRRKVLGPNHPSLVTSLVDLVATLEDRAAVEQRLSIAREAHELALRTWGEDHVGTAAAATMLAKVEYEAGAFAASTKLYRAALPPSVKANGEGSARVANLEAGLLRALAAAGDVAACDELDARLANKLAALDAAAGAEAQMQRAQAMLTLQRFALAERHTLAAHAACLEKYGADHRRCRRAAEQMVRILSAWDAAVPGRSEGEPTQKWRALVGG